MEINRNNYQVWVSDYHDGALGEDEEKILFDFLEMNPELMAEFNSYRDLVLFPDISIRIDKTSLKKELKNEDPDAIEHCALALSENDLSPELEKEFTELLSRSATAKKELEIYKALRLKPEAAVYPGKISLKRIPFRAAVARNALRIIASAASIALVISLYFILSDQQENTYTYNSAYLLPFNNTTELSETDAPAIASVLISQRPSVKTININERKNEDISLEAEPKHLISAPVSKNFLADVRIVDAANAPALMAMGTSEEPLMENDPYNENLSPRQFVAMNFRKLLLKEEDISTDKLKVYEVADAGINGLNKLLGWEMEFEKERPTMAGWHPSNSLHNCLSSTIKTKILQMSCNFYFCYPSQDKN